MIGGVTRVHLHPFPDESAPSLLIRAASSLSPLPSAVITKLLGGASYAASAVHRTPLAQPLAEFLGVPEAEVLRTMIHVDENNCVRIGSFSLHLTHVVLGVRRTCPRRFVDDSGTPPYDRIVWSIRTLKVDPDTGYPLISDCPICAGKLLWSNTTDLERCGSCHVKLPYTRDPQTFVRGPEQSFAKLFASDPKVRARHRAQLPQEIQAWLEADIISLVDCLSKLIAKDVRRGSDHQTQAIKSIFQGKDAIISILSQAIKEYRSLEPRWTDAIAYARLGLFISRNATETGAAYLNSLAERALWEINS